MRFSSCLAAISLSTFFLFILCPTAFASHVQNTLSLQGYTGLINTPNALIVSEGEMAIMYSTQIDPQWRDQAEGQDNYMFSLGALPFIEGGVRLTEVHGGSTRDLSANFKLLVPWIPPDLFHLAVGVQDVAGGAPHLRNSYAVLSREISSLRLSAGYGFGPDRMEGLFGGAEFQAASWLQLLVEHDTEDVLAGVRVQTPEKFLPFDLALTVSTPLEDTDDINFAINFQFPLGGNPSKAAASHRPGSSQHQMPPSAPTRESPPPIAPRAELDRYADLYHGLVSLKERLVELGFEDVNVGIIDSDVLYIEFENSRFNTNEFDGIGLGLGTALKHAPKQFTQFVARLKNTNIPVMEIFGPTSLARQFFMDPTGGSDPAQIRLMQSQVKFMHSDPRRPLGLKLVKGQENPQFGHSALILHPGLRNAVGTEVGAYDYRLSLLADLVTRLWQGTNLNLRADIPLAWSDDYREGAIYNEDGDNDPVLDRIFVTQNVKLFPGLVTQFGAGMYLEDVYGVLNDTLWYSESGSHRLRMRLGRFDRKDASANDVWIGSYRYLFKPLDLYLEASAGQFFNEDRGVQFEAKRFFGDTSVSAVVTDTDEQMISFRITFPLTPRKDFKPGVIQLRGTDRFGYQLSTVLADRGDSNPTTFGLGQMPRTMADMERVMYNSDRFSRYETERHIKRMHDAYQQYKGL